MKPESLIGVDIGTGSVKAVAVGLDGTLLAQSSVEHPMERPRPGWAQNDPDQWYRGVVAAVRELVAGDRVDAAGVQGLSVVSQRDPMVLTDASYRPLVPAISWVDRRTEGEVVELCELMGRRWLIERTGVVPIAGLTLPILRWLQRHEPDAWRAGRHLLFAKDYVLRRLTGIDATDVSMPSRSVMNDVRRDDWCPEICAATGIDPSWLPRVAGRPWEPLTTLEAEAAETLGLPAGVHVAYGGADDCSATLGAGGTEVGDVCAGTGTSSDWRLVTDRCEPDSEHARGDLARHVVADRYVFEATIESTGSSLRWFRDAFGARDGDDRGFASLLEEAATVPAGADGLFFFPFVDGARRAPWYIDDASGSFTGVLSGHTRAHFVRAIVEGIAFQYPATLDVLQPDGVSADGIVLVDGEARSAVWNQLKADVLGVPVRTLAVAESAAVGSAILAGQAAGAFGSASEGAQALVRLDRVFEPDPSSHARYSEIRAAYDEVFATVRESYASQAAIAFPDHHPTRES